MSDAPKVTQLVRGFWNERGEERAAFHLELMEDKSLLDALDRLAIARGCTLAVMERGADDQPIRWAGIEWDGREVGVREAIRESIVAAKGTP